MIKCFVKIGHGEGEFLVIDEDEIEKAVKIQALGTVGIFKRGTISGNHIISIVPNIHPDYNNYSELLTRFQASCGEALKQLGEKPERKQLT